MKTPENLNNEADAAADAAAARAAVESDLEDFDALKDLILTLLPYALDDGEDPPTEANAEECVEYAADEIARLRSKNDALRAALRAEVAAAARAEVAAARLEPK